MVNICICLGWQVFPSFQLTPVSHAGRLGNVVRRFLPVTLGELMFSALKNLLPKLAVAFVVISCASVAQAGLLSADLDSPNALDVVDASAEGGIAPASGQRSDSPQQHWQRDDGLQAALPANSTTSSGMGVTGTSGASAPAFALCDDGSVALTAQLQLWLLSLDEPFHPRFIVSRLFRPPRSS